MHTFTNEHGTFARYTVVRLRNGGVLLSENDEDGVVSEVEIAADAVAEVAALLQAAR